MQIDVVIPTHRRPEKLYRLLRSINKALYGGMDKLLKVHVYRSPGEETTTYSESWLRHRTYDPEFHAGEFWNAHLQMHDPDIMVWLCDDTTVHPDWAWAMTNTYLGKFPQLDGVMGFRQDNLHGKCETAKAAFGCVGRKFINTFPERNPFCPDYYSLYVDTEIEQTARWMGRFYHAPNVKVDHFHPAAGPEYEDATHHWVRRFKTTDYRVHLKRKMLGVLWGLDFTLVRGAFQ